MDDINKRIQEVFKKKEISASEFSKKINVQRSSISHIINGRNKPSLEIIIKICNVYPEISLEWLVYDKKNNSPPLQQKKEIISKNDGHDEVEKIILLLKNGTFQTFKK